MRMTRRTVVAATTAGLLATGLVVMPASALRVPPPPEVGQTQSEQPSPALTAGRAWCACHGVPYEIVWID